MLVLNGHLFIFLSALLQNVSSLMYRPRNKELMEIDPSVIESGIYSGLPMWMVPKIEQAEKTAESQLEDPETTVFEGLEGVFLPSDPALRLDNSDDLENEELSSLSKIFSGQWKAPDRRYETYGISSPRDLKWEPRPLSKITIGPGLDIHSSVDDNLKNMTGGNFGGKNDHRRIKQQDDVLDLAGNYY